MAQLRVIADKLNKRRSPVFDFANKENIVEVLTKDTVFESVGEITNSLGKWHVNNEGHWVSEKWLSTVPLPASATVNPADYLNLSFIPEKMSWAHKYLDIPFIWKDLGTAGKDVVVGIIDTGIDTTHDDLKSCFLHNSVHISNDGTKDATTDIAVRIKDEGVGHGTQMAGIIAASGVSVYGIAPQCKLLVVKLDGDLGRTPNSVAAGINFLAGENVDLISISQTTSDHPESRIAVNHCFDAGIPIFSAIGDNHIPGFQDIDDDTFPACYCENNINKCVAIGAFDEGLNVCDFSQRNEHLALLSPGNRNRILTTSLNNHSVFSPGETSIATAISAACFALVVSFLKEKKRINLKQNALDALLKNCDDMGSVIGHDPDHGYGRINMRNALAQIKTML